MTRFFARLFATVLIVAWAQGPGVACTSFLITKGASADGSSMITYAADSHTLYGALYFWPAAKHPAGAKLKVYEWDTGDYLGEIAQARQTFRVVGNMNEYGLAIAESTFGGRPELVDSTGVMDYGSLIYIALQRARTAREAIRVMAQLVEQYGYHSGGESFSISDPNEVWIMEMVGKGVRLKGGRNAHRGAVWVAVRIPDGCVSAHANQARIRTFQWSNGTTSISSKELDKLAKPSVEVVYAHDVADVARRMGFYKGGNKDFSFSDAFAPVDFGGARFCDARVWAFFRSVAGGMERYEDYALGRNLANRLPLYVKPEGKVSRGHAARMMRDHYEGTVLDMTADVGAGPHGLPYRWRPMTWEVDGQRYVHERAIATQQTGFWFVAQSRPSMPLPLAGVLWFGVDDAATSCLTPVYSASTRVPAEFAVGNGDLLTYSPDAAFWLFTRVTNFAYLRYDLMSADIAKVRDELEERHEQVLLAADERARELYAKDPAAAVEFASEFSVNTAAAMVARWRELDHYLLVKYMDGNVKRERDGKFLRTPSGMPVAPDQPALPEWWRRAIKNDAGERLKAL